MFRTCSTAITLATFIGLAASGCAVDTPLTPAPPAGTGSTSAPDGSTLKVGAPTLVSPINSDTVNTQRPTLTISAAAGQFANQTFQYEFELQSDAGAVLTRATVSSLTFTVPGDLGVNGAFRWRARAVLSGAEGPYSALGRFQTPRLTTPTVGSSDTEWKNWFLTLIDLRNAGLTVSIQGLVTLEPDMTAAQVLIQRTSAGTLRPRLYLPTGNPNNLYGRTVDLGDIGRPWQWIPRGSTTCEGAGCR
jgi:hypothetical protein